MTDKILLKAIQNKEEDSLGLLIERYGHYVSAVVFQVGNGYFSKEDVEEIAADVFVALWKSEIDTEQNIKPWLARAARNMTISRFRKYEAGGNKQTLPLNEDIMIFEKDITDDLALQREMQEALNEAVGKLAETEREIFTRFYFFNEKIQAIAQRLKLNQSTIKTKLRRSRLKLQKELEERGYGYED